MNPDLVGCVPAVERQVLDACPGWHDLLTRTSGHLILEFGANLSWYAAPTGNPPVDDAVRNAIDLTTFTPAGVPCGVILARGLVEFNQTVAVVRRAMSGVVGNACAKLYGFPVWRHRDWLAAWDAHQPILTQAGGNPAEYFQTASVMRLGGGAPAASLFPDVREFVERVLLRVGWLRTGDGA